MPKVGMEPIRREQLIKATLEVVRENGLSGATIAKISKRAGVSVGIISHYFGDKEGLVIASMKYLLAEIYANQLAYRQSGQTPQDRIKAIVQANFSPSQTDPAAVVTWLSFWAEAMHHPELARLQQINRRRLKSNLAYSFGQMMPQAQAREAAIILTALIDGLWLHGAFDPGGINANQALSVCNSHIDRVCEDSVRKES